MFFNHFFKYKTEMKYSLIAILLFSFTALQAQVKGTVKDNLGDPIAGANLFWQGTTQGTTTSADGTFSLSKPNDKHMLVVSFYRFLRTIRYTSVTAMRRSTLSCAKGWN